jgi:hypothetical protein
LNERELPSTIVPILMETITEVFSEDHLKTQNVCIQEVASNGNALTLLGKRESRPKHRLSWCGS